MGNEVLVALKIFFSFTIAFLFCFYLVPILKDIAFQFKILDTPDGSVKKHKKPTAYLGGVALFIGFISSISLTLPFYHTLFAFFIGSTLLLFIGLIDDLIPFKPYQKFFGQIIAVLCFLRAGFYLKSHFFNNYWAIPISFLWMLVVINAFNLVDVMDGLATILASCATASFFVIALFLGQYSVAILFAALLGALLAFFWYNKPTASMYLGDAGALFLGGILSVAPFMINWGVYNIYGYISSLIILAIPLLEFSQLIIIRTCKGIPFYNASPDHFSLYLQKKGWKKKNILWYIVILSILLFSGAFLFAFGITSIMITIGLGMLFLFLWLGILFS